MKEKGIEKRGQNLKQNTEMSTIDTSVEPHSTRQELADKLNWSTGKVAQAQYVDKHADEETKEENQVVQDKVIAKQQTYCLPHHFY